MRASFLIVFALAVGAAVGYFGPILVRAASSEAEFVFPAPTLIRNMSSYQSQMSYSRATHDEKACHRKSDTCPQ